MPSGESERLELALGLHEDGVALQRENLRRRNPHRSDEEIEEALAAWLGTRPGAETGDAEGTPVPLPRHR